MARANNSCIIGLSFQNYLMVNPFCLHHLLFMIPYNSKKNIHFNDPLTLLHTSAPQNLIPSFKSFHSEFLSACLCTACKHSSLSVVYSITEMNYSMKLAILVICLFIPGQSIMSPVQPSPVNTSLTAGEFRPMEPAEYRLIGRKGENHDDDLWRRRLAPFQLCLLCKCCTGAATTNCATMPCCFGIDCQLPNKPYGVCAFVPKTCNCTSCAAV